MKDGIRYYPHDYEDEQELQNLVENNIEKIFGQNAVFFKGSRIGVPRGQRGAKGIPDGFVLLVDKKEWLIVEVELSSHPVYGHVVEQVGRFSQAWKEGSSKKDLVNRFFESYTSSKIIQYKFEQCGIEKEVFRFISELINSEPKVVIIIDKTTPDLELVKSVLSFDTNWLTFKAFQRECVNDPIQIFEYEPFDEEEIHVNPPKEPPVKETPTVSNGNRTLLFQGKTFKFTYSKEIPVIVANELISEGYLDKKKVPWGAGKKRYLVNIVPKHPTGKDFVAPVQLVNGWWVETHASEGNNTDLSTRLAKWCGLTDAVLNVK
jgi:hypothetical protein